jgi:hypothetical protein
MKVFPVIFSWSGQGAGLEGEAGAKEQGRPDGPPL